VQAAKTPMRLATTTDARVALDQRDR